MKNLQVCLDANIIVWSLVPFPLSQTAETLLDLWQKTGIELIAPSLLAFEVASTLRRLVYLKHLSPTSGEIAFARFQRIPIQFSTDPKVVPLAWQFAKELNRPRAYDTSYLAVAQLHTWISGR